MPLDLSQVCISSSRAVSFNDSHMWANSISRPLFWKSLVSPSREVPRTPHIILAILAHVTFFQAGPDFSAQFRALRFADESRGIVEYSLLAGSKDPSIIQAAVILTAFEVYPHVMHTSNRWKSMIFYLDRVIRACGLSQLDAHSPMTSRSAVGLPISFEPPTTAVVGQPLQPLAPYVQKWAVNPPWGQTWGVGETKCEEIRRMLWHAINISVEALLYSNDRPSPVSA